MARPIQVWAADITYLPKRRGLLNLVTTLDRHTRKVLTWRISNTLEAGFCVDALNEAMHRFGPPKIMSTDQGNQFTSFIWTDRRCRTATSRANDARFRSELLNLEIFYSLRQAQIVIIDWLRQYNHTSPKQAHNVRPLLAKIIFEKPTIRGPKTVARQRHVSRGSLRAANSPIAIGFNDALGQDCNDAKLPHVVQSRRPTFGKDITSAVPEALSETSKRWSITRT